MLEMPDYIRTLGLVSKPLSYDWDDENPEESYLGHDERLRSRVHAIAERGVVALALGFAEWTVWRLSEVATRESRECMAFIEAVWAGIIDWRYLAPYEGPDPEDWAGRKLGPLWAAFDLVDDVVELASTGQFCSPEAVYLANLAAHVVPSVEAFKAWRRSAIMRLVSVHPSSEQNTVGDPVPRQVLDPKFKYNPGAAPGLLDGFLRRLEHRQNPYLASPEAMAEAGFKGTPYRYPAGE